MPNGDLGHLWSLEQHADVTDRLAKYNFLFIFSSDLKPMWNHCRVISHESQQHRNPQQEEE